jgi:hypothetical protein
MAGASWDEAFVFVAAMPGSPVSGTFSVGLDLQTRDTPCSTPTSGHQFNAWFGGDAHAAPGCPAAACSEVLHVESYQP